MRDPFAALEREVEDDLEKRFVRVITARWPAARIRKGRWEGHRGAFDRVVMLPGPIIAFAELKNGTRGRRSGPQREEEAALRAMGFLARFVSNDEELEAFVIELENATQFQKAMS